MTVASVDSKRQIDFIFSQREADEVVDLRCHREVTFHHHAVVSDGERRFHVDIAYVERTIVYLVAMSQGSIPHKLCL